MRKLSWVNKTFFHRIMLWATMAGRYRRTLSANASVAGRATM